MSSGANDDPQVKFYLVAEAAFPKLRELAAAAPVLPGEQDRVEAIRSCLREAPKRYEGQGEHLATLMAYVDEEGLLIETEGDARSNLELHLSGRFTIYATNAEQRARAAPDRTDPAALQRYWEEQQLQRTDAGDDIHAALGTLHANLEAAGDNDLLVVHW